MKRVLLSMMFVALEAAASTSRPGEAGVRFQTVDVVLETTIPVSAWQVEVTADGDARVVGVEGGEEPPFDAPPFYDPAALQHGRIVLAAYDVGRGLPAGRHRVATLHMREAGAAPRYHVELVAAGDFAGERITALASIYTRSTP